MCLRDRLKALTHAQRIVPTMHCSLLVVKPLVRSVHIRLVRHATSSTHDMCWCTYRRNVFMVRTNQSSYDSNPHDPSTADRVPKSHSVRITGGEICIRKSMPHGSCTQMQRYGGNKYQSPQRMFKELQLHFFHSHFDGTSPAPSHHPPVMIPR